MCATCKIFESVISETVLMNATGQGLMCHELYAYRKGYSCCTQLLVYQNELTRWINDGDFFDVISLTFGLRSNQPRTVSFSTVCPHWTLGRAC